MIAALRNWWWARQRAIDMAILWPQCLALAPDVDHARAAFAVHAFSDPAWVSFYGERGLYELIDKMGVDALNAEPKP